MPMKKNISYIFLKRFLSSIILLFALLSLVFILVRLAPGDPILRYISPELSQDLRQEIIEQFALNRPLIEQYYNFLINLFNGDFGTSFIFRDSVMLVILSHLPITFFLATAAIILQFIFSILITFLIFKRDKKGSTFIETLMLIVYSLPSFVIAIFLVVLFSVWLGVLPTGGLTSSNFSSLSEFGKIFDLAKHLVLPVITISLPGIIVYTKYLTDEVSNTATKNFVLKLRLEGKSPNKIYWKNILRNSIGPLITISGVEFGMLLGGALITEVVFSIPGFGQLSVNAVLNRDYPLVTGTVLFSALFVILSNLFADLIRLIIDKTYYKSFLSNEKN